MIKKSFLICLGLGALLLPACTDYAEPAPGSSAARAGGEVTLEIVAAGADFAAPVTRTGSAEEGLVDFTPWVLVFDGADRNAVFSEARKAVYADSKSYVSLNKKDFPCQILIIANTPESFRDGTDVRTFSAAALSSALAGVTFQDAVTGKLNSVLLASPQNGNVPYTDPARPLPMAGMWSVGKIDAATTLGTPANGIVMQRMVARVSVTNAADPANFTLLAATVVNAPRSGWFFRADDTPLRDNSSNLTEYVRTGPGGEVLHDVAPGGATDTKANPLYVYESRRQDNTAIVIKAAYRGTEGWYKLAFRADDNTVMDVLRNRSYDFVINGVSGYGYATYAEAVANPPSNMLSSEIVVTDLSSHEISDNGAYFLGLSNSEFVIFYDGALAEASAELAVTVTTNAPAGISPNSVSTTDAGLYLKNDGPEQGKLTVTGAPSATDISVYFTENFTSGSFTVRLGGFTKVVTVKRYPKLLPMETFKVFGDNYTGGQIEKGNDSFGLSFTNNIETAGSSLTSYNPAGAPLYFMFMPNVDTGGDREAVAYLNRVGEGKRVRVKAHQYYVSKSGYVGYTGTFHRWNEVHERIVRIPYSDGTVKQLATGGAWTATVIRGRDFICLDRNLGARTYPYGEKIPFTSPTAYPLVESGSRTVSGVATLGSPVVFRVGMEGPLASKTSKPRYGLIHLSFNDHTESQFIWVRQGEEPDQIVGPAKWGVYNMKDPSLGSGGTSVTNHKTIQPNYSLSDYEKMFVSYPSQGGYLFQWNLGSGTANRRAYHPTNPYNSSIIGYPLIGAVSWATSNEPCPAGYKSPTQAESYSEGSYSGLVDYNVPADMHNASWGFYADGFFDRGTIVDPLTKGQDTLDRLGYSVREATTYIDYKIAHMGTVIFNTGTLASVFMPAAGFRLEQGQTPEKYIGGLHYSGVCGYYWTRTINTDPTFPGTAYYLHLEQMYAMSFRSDRQNAFSVRCVKTP